MANGENVAAPMQSFKLWSAAIFCRLHHTFYSGAKGSMEEHRLCKFENKMLQNTFVPKMVKVKVTQASNFYSSPIIKMTKARRMRCRYM